MTVTTMLARIDPQRGETSGGRTPHWGYLRCGGRPTLLGPGYGDGVVNSVPGRLFGSGRVTAESTQSSLRWEAIAIEVPIVSRRKINNLRGSWCHKEGRDNAVNVILWIRW